MRRYSRVELTTLDDFDVAIVSVGQDGFLTYLNRAAQGLLGCPADVRIDLRMLFPQREEYELAAGTLQRRPERSASYRTVLHRPWMSPPVPIPVHIHAFPNSEADGRPDGAIALVEDLREEDARAAINAALAASASKDELLDAVATQLRTLVPFDEFHVTMVSKSCTRMRELFAKDAHRAFRELVRWWTLPDFLRDTLQDRVPEVCHVDAMRADARYAELASTDPDTAAFFGLGVREFLSVPVRHDNLVVAFVALYSYRDGIYDDDHLAQLANLPLAEAVMAALHRDHDERQQVIIDLLQRMGQRTADIQQVAHGMVSDLLRQFDWGDWQHVSVFQYDDQMDAICLICQANEDGPALPEQFAMPATIAAADGGRHAFNGPVARAALTGELVNGPGGRADSPRAALPGFDPRGSQLALPILGEGNRWVLYIESRVMNAFADEEIEPLLTLTARAAAILVHSAIFERQTAVLRSISDAVIETNAAGHVRWCNAAARAMLDIPPDPAGTFRLLDLAADAAAREALIDPDDFYHREANLRRPGDRPPLAVLLSATTPEHLGGRVYVASDFTYQKEVQRMDELKEVFTQAALEGRVPLALASAWLEQHADGSPVSAGDVDKILRQMARADLPLERLLRLSTPLAATDDTSLSDLDDALAATLAELPASLRDHVDAAPVAQALPVSGEFNDIQFCVESMLSFGLRTRPASKRLRVTTRFDPPVAVLRVEGDWIPNSREGVTLGQVERWRRKTLYDLTLGDSVIQRIVERAGGSYARELDGCLLLEIAMPVRVAAGALP